MQVKYGESVAGGHLAYHVDTFNSVLHMAVAITGTRTLYLQHLDGGNVVKCASDLVSISYRTGTTTALTLTMALYEMFRIQDQCISQVPLLLHMLLAMEILKGVRY